MRYKVGLFNRTSNKVGTDDGRDVLMWYAHELQWSEVQAY